MEIKHEKSNLIDLKCCAEVYTNISAAHIFISCVSKTELKSMKIKLHKDFFIISLDNYEGNGVHQLKINVPPNFFIPVSFYSDCSSFSILDGIESGVVVAIFTNGNLNEPSLGKITASFRVQVNGSLIESHSAKTTGKISFKEPEMATPYELHCRQCKTTLRDNAVSFKKVVAVLGDPHELSEAFFCHKHENQAEIVSQKEDELYFMPNYYRLVCLQNDYLSVDESSNILCRKCHSFLGIKQKRNNLNGDASYCFRDKIVFHTVDADMSVWPSKSEISLCLLMEIIRTTLENSVTCKLVLETKVSQSNGKCLLLWVMSQNLKLFQVHQNIQSTKKLEKKFELNPFMKVLYHESSRNSELARSWLEKFNVDYYLISDDMMKEILKILTDTSICVQQSPQQSIAPSFSIGYLPMDC